MKQNRHSINKQTINKQSVQQDLFYKLSFQLVTQNELVRENFQVCPEYKRTARRCYNFEISAVQYLLPVISNIQILVCEPFSMFWLDSGILDSKY